MGPGSTSLVEIKFTLERKIKKILIPNETKEFISDSIF